MAQPEADDTAERSETACSKEQPEGWPQASKGHPSRRDASLMEGPAPSGPQDGTARGGRHGGHLSRSGALRLEGPAPSGPWDGTARGGRHSRAKRDSLFERTTRRVAAGQQRSSLQKRRPALEGPAPSGPWAVGGDGAERGGRHGGHPSRSGASRLEGPAPSGPWRLAGMARGEADDTEVIPPEVVLRAWRDQLRLVRGRLVGSFQVMKKNRASPCRTRQATPRILSPRLLPPPVPACAARLLLPVLSAKNRLLPKKCTPS